MLDFERKKQKLNIFIYCYLCTFNFGIYITYILGGFLLSWGFSFNNQQYKIKYVIKIKLKEHKSVRKQTFFIWDLNFTSSNHQSIGLCVIYFIKIMFYVDETQENLKDLLF